MELKPDPPVRAKCAQCGKKRAAVKPHHGVPAENLVDPFCSTDCCRAWHGVESVLAKKGPPRKYTEGRLRDFAKRERVR